MLCRVYSTWLAFYNREQGQFNILVIHPPRKVAIILDAALNNRQGSRDAQSLQSDHVSVTAWTHGDWKREKCGRNPCSNPQLSKIVPHCIPLKQAVWFKIMEVPTQCYHCLKCPPYCVYVTPKLCKLLAWAWFWKEGGNVVIRTYMFLATLRHVHSWVRAQYCLTLCG